jgi:hypothetical protein
MKYTHKYTHIIVLTGLILLSPLFSRNAPDDFTDFTKAPGFMLQEAVVSISGRITNADGVGIYGVNLTFSTNTQSITTRTDFNGNYRQDLPEAWSGDVIPEKEGYGFGPSIRRYPPLAAHRSGQDFRAAATSPVISGIVADNRGVGIPGVDLIFSGKDGEQRTAASDANGNYVHAVENGWSGTVTASKKGFDISSPGGPYTYNNISSDQAGRDYSASATFPVLSGRVTRPSGIGFAGIKVEFFAVEGTTGAFTYSYTYTNDNGNYIHALPPGWSGTVTPSQRGRTFEPEGIFHDPIDSDLSGQIYRALPVISGRVAIPTGTGIQGLARVNMVFTSSGGERVTRMTDGGGYYFHAVKPGWSGTLKPEKSGFHFSPYRPTYPPVASDQGGQNFNAGANLIDISLHASRQVERALVIRKQYGKIQLSFAGTIGGAPVSIVNEFRIYRFLTSGDIEVVQTIGRSELLAGGTYTYHHRYLNKDELYTYIARAFDKDNHLIGESNEQTI